MMKTVLLIGTQCTMHGIAQKLEQEGVESCVAPLLDVDSVYQPVLPVEAAKIDAVLLTSPNAGKIMRTMMHDRNKEFCWLKKTSVIAIGKTTAGAADPDVLNNHRFPDNWWIGDRTNTTLEILLTRWQQQFLEYHNRAPVIVHMCGDQVSQSTQQSLSLLPIMVKRWVVYRIVMIKEWSHDAWQHIAGFSPVIIAVYSANAARALANMATHHSAHYGLNKNCTARHVVVCFHHDVYRVVKNMPWRKIVLAPYQSRMNFTLVKQSSSSHSYGHSGVS